MTDIGAHAESVESNSLGHLDMYKFWAWLGVAWMILIIYVWGSWIISGDAVRIAPEGLTDADSWRVVTFRIIEIGGVIAALAMLAWFVVRPWIKQGRLSDFGLMMLVFPFLWFQDPFVNMVAPTGVLSSIFTNYGNWTEHFPLTIAPNVGRVPEPFPLMPCMYIVVLGGSALLNAVSMRAAARRFRNGLWPAVFAGIGTGLIFDLCLELPAIWLEVWGYPGAIQSLSFWPDTRHQYPIYAVLLLGITEFLWASMLFFRNGQGELPFEGGIKRSGLSGARRTGVRYLALFGALQSIFFVVYFVPWSFFAMHVDSWPAAYPEHMINGVCGEGTPYICPGEGVPILRGDEGLVITPDGELSGQIPD